MTAQLHPLKTRLHALRNDPRIKALSLFGPAGQIFELVDLLLSELDSQAAALRLLAEENRRQARALAQLETHLASLGALRVNPINGG